VPESTGFGVRANESDRARPFGADYDGPMNHPDRLFYTGDEAADRLIATDPLALLIGFTLDQQVTVQKAFSGPLELTRRTGRPLDARAIAQMDPAELAGIFQERPALHRFPGAMAGRVQALCAAIATDYDDDPASIWTGAKDARDLHKRLLSLPGIGEMKAHTITAVLAKRYGLDLPGLAESLPKHPTLGDVDSAESLATYQAGKRAFKASARAAAAAKS
jgi:uncharacterized HhH-GPD family protein